MTDWIWPLRAEPLLPDEPGRFGVKRRFDYHTGVDLYCEEGTNVVAVEDGVVVKIDPFTGPSAASPWWNPTLAVLIEGRSGVVVYGEVASIVNTGASVVRGQTIGVVLPVLRTFKGRPQTMLHLELLAHGSRETLWWRHDETCPPTLIDPEPYLPSAPRFSLDTYDMRSFRRN